MIAKQQQAATPNVLHRGLTAPQLICAAAGASDSSVDCRSHDQLRPLPHTTALRCIPVQGFDPAGDSLQEAAIQVGNTAADLGHPSTAGWATMQ